MSWGAGEETPPAATSIPSDNGAKAADGIDEPPRVVSPSRHPRAGLQVPLGCPGRVLGAPPGERNCALGCLLWGKALSWVMCPFPVPESCGSAGNGEHRGTGGGAAAAPRAGAHHPPRGVLGAAPPDPTQGWVTVGEPGQHLSRSCVKTNQNKIK